MGTDTQAGGFHAGRTPFPGPVLVGDVGGTNCRLALMTPDGAMIARQRYGTDDFPTPGEAMAAFLAQHPAHRPACGAVAIAAPTGAERVQLTNSGWRFDRAGLERALGLAPMLLVNDLAAQARAVLDAPEAELVRIGEPAICSLFGTVAVVGPGTGLGVARIEASAGHVAATEGGHVGFAPNDEVELELLRLWRPHLGRVTNEHVVSGPGLVRVYRGLGALSDRHVEPIEGPEIMRRAIADTDSLCTDAVERFAKVLGAVCADIVLAQGANALALVGGIPEAMLPFLHKGGFRARFEQRGPGGSFLATVPTVFVATQDLGLKGAFAWLTDVLVKKEHA